ncbi:MAG: 4Fe-4S binding protein [Thermoflexaceae bacterium]|nr:4Fe-4S binding protein [Thermoflexaceae bacterium]
MTGVEEKEGRTFDSEGSTTYVVSSDCMNCGVCEFMCHTGAIVQAPNQFIIKKHLCDGCAACVPFCPAEAIVRRDRLALRQEDTVRARLRQVLGGSQGP